VHGEQLAQILDGEIKQPGGTARRYAPLVDREGEHLHEWARKQRRRRRLGCMRTTVVA